ncbi:MAG: right-handed parallel beta-helix repeat-containing protein [Candidatus Eisenbacteria bacterium]|nr:right-handed parallel beta-helix repeat-containing protein [Candidatus Eisenbacteria bacterium]
MRFVFSALLIGLLAVSAGARTIRVPDEELGLTAIQQAVVLAEPGDTVLVRAGIYDSVHTFQTPLGLKHAVVGISEDIVLKGEDRANVIIDQQNTEYGILCQGVGRNALITTLTITGGVSRDQGLTDDGDGRFLTAAIACLDDASPTIRSIDIKAAATGIIVRSSTADSAPLIERVVIARGSHHGIYVYQNGTEPVEINRTTIVDNFDYGVYVSSGEVIVRNTAITHNGKYGVNSYLSSPVISYCDLYWNDRMFPDPEAGPLDYGPSLTNQTGINGNISAEPYYCDFVGSSGYNYSVCLSDPVSPLYQAGEGGVTIGAMSANCTGCIPSPVEPASWGAIKALYR